MARRRKAYKVCAAYDTETTSVQVNGEWRAFAYLYQINDLRSCDLPAYEPGKSDDVKLYRTASQVLAYIGALVEWGEANRIVPIIAGYNIMFDLQTIFADLCRSYGMEVNAQSSTNVYTLDLTAQDGSTLLRFWDTYHLEMRGLAAMGATAGIEKLVGDLDYSLVRTPETPLTDAEIGYAVRDVQVIPAYLRYLLDANEWLTPDMLGVRVLTKTSLVRQMARNEIAPLKVRSGRARKTLEQLFMAVCQDDLPGCYYDYGLRKACFRGGLTFTAARYASVVVRNVASLDVTSMHHLFINGRYIPEQFRPLRRRELDYMVDAILRVSREQVLREYHKPLPFAIHARLRFKNIRLKRGTCFEAWGIASIPRGKFGHGCEGSAEYSRNDAERFAVRAAKLNGWRDRADNARFAFGKLYSADVAELHVSEVELWAISRVYEWDELTCVLGEGTAKFAAPPDYVTLQSNVFFARKQDMKKVNKTYEEGVPYADPIPASIPEGIAKGLRAGTLTNAFVESYYSSTVKGMFNSIYGTMAQDVMKAGYTVDKAAALLEVDRDTVLSPDNFFERLPKRPKVAYNYGMRIVGGSRLHLILAMEMVYETFGERAHVTGGDTDSLKVACAKDITDDDLAACLQPLADAAKRAIDKTQTRVRKNFPQLASSLEGIGVFDVEGCGAGRTRYDYHMEAWNKARVSIDYAGGVHVTCAGLSRPDGAYHIEHYIADMLKDNAPDVVLPAVLGYNVIVDNGVCHALQRTSPSALDVFDADATDYMGRTAHVTAPEAVALYPVSRALGETDMPVNAENVAYVRDVYGRDIDVRERRLSVCNGKPVFETEE